MPERMVRNASAHHLAVSFSHTALVLAQMPFTHSVHQRPALGWGGVERASFDRPTFQYRCGHIADFAKLQNLKHFYRFIFSAYQFRANPLV